MPQGISLSIGLNAVDPKQYGGWPGILNACEADAEDMTEIANAQGFKSQKLLTTSATRAKVTAAIKAAAAKLKSGDIFMITYSGHGGQVPDSSGDEDDGQDETWCLYDGQIIDDELNVLYSTFAKGVRILVFSDSCHSGTVIKAAYYTGSRGAPPMSVTAGETRYRFMPKEIALRTYRDNKAFYDKLQKKTPSGKDAPAVKASIISISGCQDNQLSSDGTFNGLFTGHLLSVWRNGVFQGDYHKFHKEIGRRMPPDQTPKFFLDGESNSKFEEQEPFTV